MLVSVNFILDQTPVYGPVSPVCTTSATAATDTDNKVFWLADGN